jgi:hypothetical protein
MRVYSPSQTATWLECPVKRHLAYVEHWRPRLVGKRELAAVLGTAVAAGVEAYHRARMAGQSNHPAEHWADMASQTARLLLRQLQDSGFQIAEYDQAQADALPGRAAKAVQTYLAAAPIPADWAILEVEQVHQQYGSCRLDLVVRDEPDHVAAVDLKVKLRLEPRYRPKEIERYRHHWAMLHYTWVVEQVYGQTPRRYYILFLVLEPAPESWLQAYLVDEEVLRVWEQSARRVWTQMEVHDTAGPDDRGPWIAAKHADEYGPCEYYDACFEYRWDPALMSHDYVQFENRRAGDATEVQS